MTPNRGKAGGKVRAKPVKGEEVVFENADWIITRCKLKVRELSPLRSRGRRGR